MTRTVILPLAATVMLAMLACGPASGQQSAHTGGVNALMGDGSVRFIKKKSGKEALQTTGKGAKPGGGGRDVLIGGSGADVLTKPARQRFRKR